MVCTNPELHSTSSCHLRHLYAEEIVTWSGRGRGEKEERSKREGVEGKVERRKEEKGGEGRGEVGKKEGGIERRRVILCL